MKRSQKIASGLLALVLIAMFVVSVFDTNETRKSTNFNQDNMMAHIEKLSENGPHSIVDKEANDTAIEYIISQVESWGVTEGDTTDAPAYTLMAQKVGD